MGQLLYLLSFLPDWFWGLVLVVGISATLAAWVLRMIPFVKTYSLPLNVAGVLLTLAGVYYQGVIANEEKWLQRIDELEEAVKEAEAKAKTTNVEIQKEIVYQDRVIKEKGDKQIQYIDRIVKGDTIKETVMQDMTPEQRAAYEKQVAELQTAIKNCPVPKIVIEEHNKAAINPTPAKGEKK
jgi:hypothetical protein